MGETVELLIKILIRTGREILPGLIPPFANFLILI